MPSLIERAYPYSLFCSANNSKPVQGVIRVVNANPANQLSFTSHYLRPNKKGLIITVIVSDVGGRGMNPHSDDQASILYSPAKVISAELNRRKPNNTNSPQSGLGVPVDEFRCIRQKKGMLWIARRIVSPEAFDWLSIGQQDFHQFANARTNVVVHLG